MFARPKNIRDDISRRSWIVAIILIALGGRVIYRIIDIQHFERYKGRSWKEWMSNTVHIDTIQAMRGNIYAHDGSLMATSLPYFEVSLDPTISDSTYFYSRIDSLATLFAQTFGQRTRDEYRRQLLFERREYEQDHRRGNRNIRLLKRKITYREYNLILNQPFSKEIIENGQKKTLRWKGWPFFRQFAGGRTRGGKMTIVYDRYYPFESLAYRTVGYLDPKTKKGLVGLEANYEKTLAGTPGVGLFRVLEDKTFVPNEEGTELQPTNGHDLHTTLDVNFQDIAETALQSALQRYRASYGSVVVMEVATGDIRAIANLSRAADSSYSERYNHALAGITNPGSTFKLATMLAAFEEGLPLQRIYHTGDGVAKYSTATISDTKNGGHGSITAQQVFEKSSNVGVHLIMQDYFYKNPNKYLGYLKRFHLRETTGIDMRGETPPKVRTPTDRLWSKPSLTYMSYGYESELTPLQMLAFYNAIANDGYWVRPRIVRQIKNGQKVVAERPVFRYEQKIASDASIRKARFILEGVVANGTAKNIKNDTYKIAGKTGTAQKLINGRYVKGMYNTSFIGYFPADKPRYTCIVVIDSPRGYNMEQLYAGSVAAPVFKEIADRIVGYDINMHPPIQRKPTQNAEMAAQLRAGQTDDLRLIAQEMNIDAPANINGWVEAKKSKKGVSWQDRDLTNTPVPNLKGMTLRDALYLLENRGFKVSYQGHGKVTDYSQDKGSYRLVLQ